MKVLILAGGIGSRLSEETITKPKPMVEIGGRPILWHIMKIYSHFGYNEFVILCGYKGFMIKEYFANYFMHSSDITINLFDNSVEYHNNHAEPWKITIVDTGEDTMTGGRIKRVQHIVGDNPFLLTYGDGVADLDITSVVDFHKQHNGAITMTSAQPEGRFGALDIEADNRVSRFLEKPKGDGAWINAGFFVCEPKIFDYISGDDTIWEKAPLSQLAEEGELYTFKHKGFWHPMDTLRDTIKLNELYNNDEAQWKLW